MSTQDPPAGGTLTLDGINSSLTITVGIALLIFMITAVALHLRRTYVRSKKYPPMTKYPFSMFFKEFQRGKNHQFQLKNSRETGLIYRLPLTFFVSRTIAFAVCDATVARLILEGDDKNDEEEKSSRYRNLAKITLGIPTMVTKRTHGEGWDWSRKAVSPSFSNTNLYKLLPDLHIKLDELKSILNSHINQKKPFIDLSAWMVRLTIDFLAKSLFRVDFGTLHHHSVENGTSEKNDNISSDGHILLENLSISVKEFTLNQALNPMRKYMIWNKDVLTANIAAKTVEAIGLKVLNKYREEHSVEDLNEDKTIIAHLLLSPYPSDRERVADVTTFMIAGHETTAYQISWIIIEVSKHPEVLDKLREELDLLIPGHEGALLTPQLLSKMAYLTNVIREGMRLWPVLPTGSQRVLSRDIPYGPYVLPKGATVGIGHFSMFRAGINNPDTFLPDRWLDTDTDAIKLKEMFIPFSIGRRGCVGQTLALFELKLVLATLFYSYDFKLISEVEEFFFLSLKPQNANFEITKRIRVPL